MIAKKKNTIYSDFKSFADLRYTRHSKAQKNEDRTIIWFYKYYMQLKILFMINICETYTPSATSASANEIQSRSLTVTDAELQELIR